MRDHGDLPTHTHLPSTSHECHPQSGCHRSHWPRVSGERCLAAASAVGLCHGDGSSCRRRALVTICQHAPQPALLEHFYSRPWRQSSSWRVGTASLPLKLAVSPTHIVPALAGRPLSSPLDQQVLPLVRVKRLSHRDRHWFTQPTLVVGAIRLRALPVAPPPPPDTQGKALPTSQPTPPSALFGFLQWFLAPVCWFQLGQGWRQPAHCLYFVVWLLQLLNCGVFPEPGEG